MIRQKENGRKKPRLCYFRGHGIHSPAVYSLVRSSFVQRSLNGSDTKLFDELRSRGVDKKTARHIHNLKTHYGSAAFGFGSGESGEMVMLTEGKHGKCMVDKLLETEDRIVVIVNKKQNRELIVSLIGSAVKNERLVIDKRRFFVVFGRRYEPYQYFRI